MTTVHLAWGAKVSKAFALRVIQMGLDFNLNPNWPMACMKFESDLSPTAKNPHSTATGLIQMMEATATHYGVTTAQLAAMTAEKQFDYVWLYFRDAIKAHGPITNLADCYMAILDPVAMGKPGDYVLWISGTSAYAVNAGLDANKDHKITKAEAAARVGALLIEGTSVLNAADIDTAQPAPAPQPKETLMSTVSKFFHFVFDNAFVGAARMAATADPNAVAGGITAVQSVTMPTEGTANSPAGVASGAIGELENALNQMVGNFIKTTIDQVPGVGAVAEVTGLDQKGADAAKALLVLAEQHALSYLSGLFSHGHAAVDAATQGSNNGA